MSRFLTLRNIVIGLAIVLLVSTVFFIFGTFLQQQPTPTSTPSPIPIQTQTGATILPTPSPVPVQLIVPPTASPSPTLNSELKTLKPLVIPLGFQIPEDRPAWEPTSLEPILPSLTPDPETGRLLVTDKDVLYFQLSRRFDYDPAVGEVTQDLMYQVLPTIIDFGNFDPESMTTRPGDNLLWFNQNTLTCQLRTDPKSPARIERTIGSQETLILQLYTPGTYLFFCQGLPGSTQTIFVP